MRKYTYTYDQPFRLQATSANQYEADRKLQRFSERINELVYEMGFIVDKGKSIQCLEEEIREMPS